MPFGWVTVFLPTLFAIERKGRFGGVQMCLNAALRAQFILQPLQQGRAKPARRVVVIHI